MQYDSLTVTRDGPIASVTLPRPNKATAANHDLLPDLERARLRLRVDSETRVVILTAAEIISVQAWI